VNEPSFRRAIAFEDSGLSLALDKFFRDNTFGASLARDSHAPEPRTQQKQPNPFLAQVQVQPCFSGKQEQRA